MGRAFVKLRVELYAELCVELRVELRVEPRVGVQGADARKGDQL